MTSARDRVVVAMSGGVDSSVAACLLVEQGYDVIGLFMRTGVESPADDTCAPSPPLRSGDIPLGIDSTHRSHQGCCSVTDAADARYVAGMLGIPFYALNFQREFDRIIGYFVEEYAAGRTPNPCVQCNNWLKFGKLMEYADAVGARYVATGHYARVLDRDGDAVLARSVDADKDQTYVLFGLAPELLPRLLFPIGHLTKPQVRTLAARYNLPNRAKPDSVEICFVPDRDYARVVERHRPDALREGPIVDATGRVLGRHRGIGRYTIGQRRGLGVAADRPLYVTRLDPATATVTLGDRRDLLASGLVARSVNLLRPPMESAADFRAWVKIRYLHQPVAARISLLPESRMAVTFDTPQPAVTPGQAAVLYGGDVLLGGGWIDVAIPL